MSQDIWSKDKKYMMYSLANLLKKFREAGYMSNGIKQFYINHRKCQVEYNSRIFSFGNSTKED